MIRTLDTRLADFENHGYFEKSLEGLKPNPNAMIEWRKKVSREVVINLDMSLSYFQMWVNVSQKSNRLFDLSAKDNWKKVSANLVLSYKNYLISEGYSIGLINERIAAIRISATLASYSGAISLRENNRIRSVTGIYLDTQ